MLFIISNIRIKGRFCLPLILFFISLLISHPINADELSINSVGRVNLEELTKNHPLTKRISRLEERIEHYTTQNLEDDRLLDLEDEILTRVESFSEHSYNQTEFIIENYNKQIERREEIARTEKDNLQQRLENEKNNKLATGIESREEEIKQAIKEAERDYMAELRSDKQEAVRDYNGEISRLKLRIYFSKLDEQDEEDKTEELAELLEIRNAKIERIEAEYEEKLADYIKEQEAKVQKYKKEYQAELEQSYQQKYEKKAEEIIRDKNRDINFLKEELEEKLAEAELEVETEIDDIFVNQIINKMDAKDKKFLERLEALEERLASLEKQKETEISQLIEKYKNKYELDLVISDEIPGVSAHDLTAEIKSEWGLVND